MKYLFVCTGNTCRSPLAEALMRQKIQNENKDHKVFSRGLYADGISPASQGSISAARELGADLSGHVSKQLMRSDIEEADIILTMSQAHKDIIISAQPDAASKVYTLGEYSGIHEDVSDPYGGDQEVYLNCANEINKMIGKIKL